LFCFDNPYLTANLKNKSNYQKERQRQPKRGRSQNEY
jgi:hypothetical protein